jgi:hypothetical protein
MELWTEYEGRTIDGDFPLGKLLQPEGRSAFFLTSNGTGAPTVIRLIESHFDDEEILARWRGVAALDHPNLAKLRKFGKAELDGTQLVYAVMEPAEANLGEIVSERRLTVAETAQIASSLVAALGALHTNGFVHEHVEPGNVFAVGEEIKLRSDCIREAPEGAEGRELKREDVRALAGVLLRALTQQRTLDAEGGLPLGAPFDAIVRKGMSGEWGLGEIEAALAPTKVTQMDLHVAEVGPEFEVASGAETAEPLGASTTAAVPVTRQERSGMLARDERETGYSTGLKIVLGLSVLVLALISWRMFQSRQPEPSGAARVGAAASTGVGAGASPAEVERLKKPSALVTAGRGGSAREPVLVTEKTSLPAVTPAALAPVAATSVPVTAPASTMARNAAASGPVQWRVVAFTYNHADQAKAKAARVAGQHPELRPEVFTPSGGAPYLVTIGGAMGRSDAYALAQKARGEGLAHDVYAQNYRGGTVVPAK